jgi:histone deacetylase 1/2
MKAEIKVLHFNGTWSLVPFHPSMNVIGCRWVYKIKHRLNGSIERYKAQLVA